MFIIQFNGIKCYFAFVHRGIRERIVCAVSRRKHLKPAALIPNRAVPADGDNLRFPCQHKRTVSRTGIRNSAGAGCGSPDHESGLTGCGRTAEAVVRSCIESLHLQIEGMLILPVLGQQHGNVESRKGTGHDQIGLMQGAV